MAKLTDLSALSALLTEADKAEIQKVEKSAAAKKTLGNGMPVQVFLDKKRRRGKTVTVVSGVRHNKLVLEDLAKDLKQLCGAGGTLKDGEIEIQGDHLPVVSKKLRELGFDVK